MSGGRATTSLLQSKPVKFGAKKSQPGHSGKIIKRTKREGDVGKAATSSLKDKPKTGRGVETKPSR